MALLTLAVISILQRVLSATIRKAIVGALQSVLGVPVKLSHLRLSLFTSTAEITGFTVSNPKGFESQTFVEAGTVRIDLDMQAFLLSRCKRLTIQELVCEDVHAAVEYRGGGSQPRHSNVAEMVQRIADKRRLFRRHGAACPQTPRKGLAGCLPCMAEAPSREREKPTAKIALQRVVVENVGLVLARPNGKASPRLDVGRLEFEDFSKESGLHVAEELALELLHTAAQRALVRLGSKEWAERVHLSSAPA